jgi:DNA-binding NarL/FixJ family response regulator
MQSYIIHICDDHPLITSGLEQVLMETDFVKAYSCSHSKEELFLFLKNNSVDLLLLDISLKGYNILDDLSFIIFNYPKLKVVFLSNYDLMDIQSKARELGAHGFISKSSNNINLIDICKKVLLGEDFWSFDCLTSIKNDTNTNFELTAREVEIVKLLLNGYTNQKIANTLFISIHTVQTHRKNIKSKLKLDGTSDLISFSNRFKLT